MISTVRWILAFLIFLLGSVYVYDYFIVFQVGDRAISVRLILFAIGFSILVSNIAAVVIDKFRKKKLTALGIPIGRRKDD
jgi:hypothetical protein